MIRNTFVMLPGIGRKAEQNIWKQGIKNWNDFIECSKIEGVSTARKHYYDRQLKEAKERLYQSDSAYFHSRLPAAEHWRLYDFFKEDAVFLDIETSGLGAEGYLTVAGLYDGNSTKTMVRGINLDLNMLKAMLQKHKLIVSFNGRAFDEPFIRKRHPGVMPELPHFDLRYACKALEMKGGLKMIEKQLGIKRENEIVQRMCGGDAALLWRMFRASGEERYLKLLIEYNEEDVVNLKQIADKVYGQLKDKLSC